VLDSAGNYPLKCQDAISGKHNVNFGITDGVVSGSQTMPQLGSKTSTFSGSVSPTGVATINVNLENLGNFSLNGSLSESTCLITGTYFHDLDSAAGTFTITSRRGGC